MHFVNILIYSLLTRVVRDLCSDVLRSKDEGIGMTVGLELSQPARQCDDKPTESVGSKLDRLWGLNLCGDSKDDRGTLTLNERGKKKKSWSWRPWQNQCMGSIGKGSMATEALLLIIIINFKDSFSLCQHLTEYNCLLFHTLTLSLYDKLSRLFLVHG